MNEKNGSSEFRGNEGSFAGMKAAGYRDSDFDTDPNQLEPEEWADSIDRIMRDQEIERMLSLEDPESEALTSKKDLPKSVQNVLENYQEIPDEEMPLGQTRLFRDERAKEEQKKQIVLSKLESITFPAPLFTRKKEMSLIEYFLITSRRNEKNPEEYICVQEQLIKEGLKQAALKGEEIEVAISAVNRWITNYEKGLNRLSVELRQHYTALESEESWNYDKLEHLKVSEKIIEYKEKSGKLKALSAFLQNFLKVE